MKTNFNIFNRGYFQSRDARLTDASVRSVLIKPCQKRIVILHHFLQEKRPQTVGRLTNLTWWLDWNSIASITCCFVQCFQSYVYTTDDSSCSPTSSHFYQQHLTCCYGIRHFMLILDPAIQSSNPQRYHLPLDCYPYPLPLGC
jgi:hypothetical protein